MAHTISNPAGLPNPVGFGYSHIVTAASSGLVLVAGQYGCDRHGELVSDDFAEQVGQAFANLGTALAAVGLDYSSVLRLGTYIVDHDSAKLPVLRGVIVRIWGETPPVQTLIGVAALALPGMLFEVDAVAVQPDE